MLIQYTNLKHTDHGNDKLSNMKTDDKEQNQDNAQTLESDSVQRRCYAEKILALSESTKHWLWWTCQRFADGGGYDTNEKAIRECIEANLASRSTCSGGANYLIVEDDVMSIVCSGDLIDKYRDWIEPSVAW